LFHAINNRFPDVKLNSTSTKEEGKHDDIFTKLLKVSSPWKYLCNKALSSGIFPDHWNFFGGKTII